MVRPVFALVSLALLLAASAASAPQTKCPNGTGFGELAFIEAGSLLVLDMPGCNGRVLVRRGARPPVRWSADGRYISFGGGVVQADWSASDGRLYRGLHGVWAPRGHQLATITARGGLVLTGPGLPTRRLLPDGFGVQSAVFAPSARLVAISRGRLRGTARPSHREIWLVELRNGSRRLVYRVPRGNDRTPMLVTWTRGGFIVFTLPLLPALSANLDGLPLSAVPAAGGRPRRIVRAALTYREFVASCGSRIVIAAGIDRVTTRAKRIVLAIPPLWKPRDLSRDPRQSWIAPACSPDGRLVAMSAAATGLERRAIWVLSVDGRTRRRLTTPPHGRSDELPRWSRDGRAVFFIRSGPTKPNATARGTLYVVRLGDHRPERVADDLGVTGNYYGRYAWAEQTDLFVPRIR